LKKKRSKRPFDVIKEQEQKVSSNPGSHISSREQF
jgi:hypothetical protein